MLKRLTHILLKVAVILAVLVGVGACEWFFFFKLDKAVVESIKPLIGSLFVLNFALSVFVGNFAFSAYQASPYRQLVQKHNVLLLTLVGVLILIPFIPVAFSLFWKDVFYTLSLASTPLIFFIGIAYLLVTKVVSDPYWLMNQRAKTKRIDSYLKRLLKLIEEDAERAKKLAKEQLEMGVSPHLVEFSPVVLGTEKDDLFEDLAAILSVCARNGDHIAYRFGFEKFLDISQHCFENPLVQNEEVSSCRAFGQISVFRLESHINWIFTLNARALNITTIVSLLSDRLIRCNWQEGNSRRFALTISRILTKIAEKSVTESSTDVLRVAAIISTFSNTSLNSINEMDEQGRRTNLEDYELSNYALMLKQIGQAAAAAEERHIVYRLMEALSYFGCYSASKEKWIVVTTCIEGIVQLGRESRMLGQGCFYRKCKIPLWLHAEEFIAHIITHLVAKSGKWYSFSLKGEVICAYSRLRGFKCKVEPGPKKSYSSWIILEVDDKNNPIPYTESESGMYGYSGTLDYSDFSMLVEHELGPSGDVFKGAPVGPIELSTSESD